MWGRIGATSTFTFSTVSYPTSICSRQNMHETTLIFGLSLIFSRMWKCFWQQGHSTSAATLGFLLIFDGKLPKLTGPGAVDGVRCPPPLTS